MQKSLGLKDDGLIGPMTRGSYEALCLVDDRASTQFYFVKYVKDYYLAIDKDRDGDGKGDFIKGWLNRLLKTMCYV